MTKTPGNGTFAGWTTTPSPISLPGWGPVSIRRMFGGKGIYRDGVIFALEVRGDLMLKADEESAPDFLAAGCRQWVYANAKSGKEVAMPYWTVPDEALDDPDEMTPWARKAFEAGLRTSSAR